MVVGWIEPRCLEPRWMESGWIEPGWIKPGWIKHGLEECFGEAQLAPEIIHREVGVRQQFGLGLTRGQQQ